MKVNFNLDGTSIMAGIIFGFVYASDVSSWWYLIGILMLFSFEVKGLPYARFEYTSSGGFKWNAGRYK